MHPYCPVELPIIKIIQSHQAEVGLQIKFVAGVIIRYPPFLVLHRVYIFVLVNY